MKLLTLILVLISAQAFSQSDTTAGDYLIKYTKQSNAAILTAVTGSILAWATARKEDAILTPEGISMGSAIVSTILYISAIQQVRKAGEKMKTN